jgi:hypothetical protein
LAFDAVHEITGLAEVARQLIEAQNMDSLGRALCGMLVRIEQLAEATMYCVDDDPMKGWGKSDQDLRDSILGRRPWTAKASA